MIRKLELANQDDIHQETLDKTGFWGTQAAGCLFVAKDTKRLLFAHRGQYVLEPDTWGTWGGALDTGETPVQGVIREIKEEAGYKGKFLLIKLSKFTHVKSGFIYHTFLAKVSKEFKPVLNWESQGYKWVEFGNWPKPLHPGLKRTLSEKASLSIIKKAIG
jgi:8-oxo-dGTP pyrophosphatase MutT (NUDIX family)